MPAGSTILSALADMEDGRPYGCGSSDMKAADSGVCRRLRFISWEAISPDAARYLMATGGEETGCDGARALIASATLPEVGALIVGGTHRQLSGYGP